MTPGSDDRPGRAPARPGRSHVGPRGLPVLLALTSLLVLPACSPSSTGPVTVDPDGAARPAAPSPVPSTTTASPAAEDVVLDDFTGPLVRGSDADGNPLGFVEFADEGDVVVSVTEPDEPSPGSGGGALLVDASATDPSGFAGVVRTLTDADVQDWAPVDATGDTALAFWFRGQGRGETLFVDLLDNRTAGATTDDAGRWTAYFSDDEPGWVRVVVPVDDLERKDIGTDAPDDGLTLAQVNGWAVGTTGTGATGLRFAVDDVTLVRGIE